MVTKLPQLQIKKSNSPIRSVSAYLLENEHQESAYKKLDIDAKTDSNRLDSVQRLPVPKGEVSSPYLSSWVS